MLRIDGLTAGYGRLEVLHDVSLAVPLGTPTVVMGANAAGKTTLCRTITGLIPARGGVIGFDGQDITRLGCAERVRRGIALMPEGRQVFGEMTVRENLRLGAYVHGEPRAADYEAVFGLFPILKERESQRAGLMSGGESARLQRPGVRPAQSMDPR